MSENSEVDGLFDCFGRKSEKVDATTNNSENGNSKSETVAKMPTDRYNHYYNMNHKNRGIAMIFNHENFDPITNQRIRTGTNKDVKSLESLFKKLKFEMWIFKDLCYTDIMKHIKQVAKYNHDDNDCLMIAVLSHGNEGTVYARDREYDTEKLWDHFTADKCPSLAGKPKMFLIQACQGIKLDKGIKMKGFFGRTETDSVKNPLFYKIPTQADFIIGYATASGYYAWRSPENGSWFIQSFCEEMEKNGFQYDLATILTFAAQKVAYDFESNNKADNKTYDKKKQIPYHVNRLTRLIQFNEK